MAPDSPALPPRAHAPGGAPRRVGVELEFAALDAGAGADIVAGLFGGRIARENPHRFHIRDTALGDFTSELDTRYAHPDPDAPPAADRIDAALRQAEATLRELFGDISAAVMPCEIVCPPVAIADLPRIERLVHALEAAGASGTRASPLHGFGAQLNVEIAAGGSAWVLAAMRAHALLSDWLRAVMEIDVTRRLTAFTDPFPPDYVALIVDPAYAPDDARLIDDYLRHNPTRNRELDMTPLLAWMDGDRVRAALDDPRIKPRPALHYRLPDANFGRPGWGVLPEWRRWCVVERLAEDRELLAAMGRDWRAAAAPGGTPRNWALRASEWLLTA